MIDWNDRAALERHASRGRKRTDGGKFAPIPKCNLPPVVREGELSLPAFISPGGPMGARPRTYRLVASMLTTGWAREQEYPVVVLDPLLPTARYYLVRSTDAMGGECYAFTIGKNKARNYYRTRYFIDANAARIRQAFFTEIE